MNGFQKTRKFERECYNWLKKWFEEVHWKSREHLYATFDFLCYNDGITFNVEAKTVRPHRTLLVQWSQIHCPLFIIKEQDGRIILSSLKTLMEKNKYQVRITNIPNSSHSILWNKELKEIGGKK